LIFNFALEYAIREGPGKPGGTKMKMGHISYWSVLIFWEVTYVDTVKKNAQTLIDASKEAGLEVNTVKTKYMLLSHHQNAGQNR
jgi:hypothetical protein